MRSVFEGAVLSADDQWVFSYPDPTRAEKKDETRQAVLLFLKSLSDVGVFSIKSSSKQDACERITTAINRMALAPFEVDEKDVKLALKWLHSKGLIKARRYQRTGEEPKFCVHIV